ncbi:hypothetical protein CKALI_01725 [Corynebacterium kalinowskii]|uniref:DUF4178 domain-containing protein n=1 Tax=Corynebacterium kalinowskii TaxID=2675216 RepID=A0A6B8VI49_9CORY|nr:DUF4178 domain-containing protein [Corynebacterium kalinowskii]QGU01244.1 hypothetical protein CKALI_01725 [Corynebacterium kalinowskii]
MSSGFIFFIVLAVIAAGAAIYFFSSAKKAEDGLEEPQRFHQDPLKDVVGADEFGPDRIAPGAIISRGGKDYVVRGTLALKEGPYLWWEHLLDGGDGSEWFGVEVDEGQLSLTWWNTRKGAGISPDSRVEFEGITYLEAERGHAFYQSIGTTGLPERGEMRYVDLADSTGTKLLGFEGWANNESWEVSTGQTIQPGELTVYPAPKV